MSFNRLNPELNPELNKENFGDKEFQIKSIEYITALIERGADKKYVSAGLSGIDLEDSWELCEKFIDENVDKGWIAVGLAGLNSERAWDMRKFLISRKAKLGWVAMGLYGDDIMAGIRKARGQI